MKYILSVICAILVLWGASVVLGSHPVWRYNDEATGLQLPVCGSRVVHLTEGYGVTHYGLLGLNPVVATPGNAKKPFFLLHGDSFIESRNVSDAQKPDVVMTRTCADRAVVYGVGRSGLGFASMIVRAMEYERVMGEPIAHVFFCTSVHSDIFEDVGIEFAKSPEGYSKHIALLSPQRQAMGKLVNRLHLNFVVDVQKNVEQTAKGFFRARTVPVKTEGDGSKTLRSELEYVVNSMANQLHAPQVIVYCPNLPRIGKGSVHLDDPEQENADLLKELAKARGIYFVDTSPAELDLYETKAIIARGFANSDGPGVGHLNEEGIKAVFGFAASKLKEHYGL